MTISGRECEKHNIEMSPCWKGDAPYPPNLLCWSTANHDELMFYINLISLYCYHNFRNAICNLTLDLVNGASPFKLFFFFEITNAYSYSVMLSRPAWHFSLSLKGILIDSCLFSNLLRTVTAGNGEQKWRMRNLTGECRQLASTDQN